MKESKPMVTIYTDGSCLGNPGPGGYGAVLLTETDGRACREEISGGYRYTTNSRMEIMAVIRALESLEEPHQVQMYSDSRLRGGYDLIGMGHQMEPGELDGKAHETQEECGPLETGAALLQEAPGHHRVGKSPRRKQ